MAGTEKCVTVTLVKDRQHLLQNRGRDVGRGRVLQQGVKRSVLLAKMKPHTLRKRYLKQDVSLGKTQPLDTSESVFWNHV